MVNDQGPLQLNLHEILRNRIKGIKGKLIPGALISLLERIICQDDLNRLLRICYPLTGSDFAQKLLETLNISIEVDGIQNLRPGHRYLICSNHPLGGLDGIALVAILGKHFGDENLRVQVNDMLMNVTPLADVFLPINKYGSQGRKSAILINEAFESDKQMVVFPAGLVSRLGANGKIADLQWQKSFVAKALTYDREIVPIFFDGFNSMRFYKTAYRRNKCGIKVNFEQILLPSELVRATGNHFKITIGKPLSPREVEALAPTPLQRAAEIRKIAYSLSLLQKNC